MTPLDWSFRSAFSTAKWLLRHHHFDLCSSSVGSLDAPITFAQCPRGIHYEGRSRMDRTHLVLHGLRMLMPFIDRIALRALWFLVATHFFWHRPRGNALLVTMGRLAGPPPAL